MKNLIATENNLMYNGIQIITYYDAVEDSILYTTTDLNINIYNKNLYSVLEHIDSEFNENWQPDWSQIDSEIKAIALDKDGGWRGYKDIPTKSNNYWLLNNNPEDYINIKTQNNYKGYWDESLRVRL